jgi:hypothetical protein
MTTNPNLDSTVIPFPVCVGEELVGRVNGNGIPPLTPTLSPLGTSCKTEEEMIYTPSKCGQFPILTTNTYHLRNKQ